MNLLKQDASEQNYRRSGFPGLLGESHIPFCIIQDARIRYFNSTFPLLLRRDTVSLLDIPFASLFPSGEQEIVTETGFLPGIDLSPGVTYRRNVRRDKGTFPVRMYFFPVQYHHQRSFLVLFEDETGFHRLQSRARRFERDVHRLGAEILSIEEQLRRQLATELHDGLTQSLAIIRMQLGALIKDPAPQTLPSRLEEIRELVDETIADTRGMVFELSPPVLYGLSLEHVMRDLSEEYQHRYPLSVTFSWTGQADRIREDLQMFLYRVLRELLVNVVKHAHAETVAVECRVTDSAFTMNVSDNGTGFKAADRKNRPGFGLLSIHERLTSLGGRLQIDSCQGRGTTVHAVLPLRSDTPENNT